MRYLLNDSYIQRDGKPMVVEDAERDIPSHHARTADVLALALRIYDENHNRFVRDGRLLSPTEIEAFNRALGILEASGDVIALETTDYTLVVKVVGWAFPTSPVWRETPTILALLQKATTLPPGAPEMLLAKGADNGTESQR